MGCYISAAALAVLAACLLIAAAFSKSRSNSFQKNMRFGKAEVAGYEQAENSKVCILLVRIPEMNDGKLYSCSSGRINTADYQVGKIVDVIYAVKRIAGIEYAEVHLADNPPPEGARIASGFRIIALALFAISIILIAVGVIGAK